MYTLDALVQTSTVTVMFVTEYWRCEGNDLVCSLLHLQQLETKQKTLHLINSPKPRQSKKFITFSAPKEKSLMDQVHSQHNHGLICGPQTTPYCQYTHNIVKADNDKCAFYSKHTETTKHVMCNCVVAVR